MKRKTSFSLDYETLQWLTKTARASGLSRSALLEVMVRREKLIQAEQDKKKAAEEQAFNGPYRRATDRREMDGETQVFPTALNIQRFKMEG
jgi:hypothetical protein